MHAWLNPCSHDIIVCILVRVKTVMSMFECKPVIVNLELFDCTRHNYEYQGNNI